MRIFGPENEPLPSPIQPQDSMHTYDSMQVGDTYSLKRFISKEDVQGFADVTGDDNPLHVDEEYAATTVVPSGWAVSVLEDGQILLENKGVSDG